VVGVLPLAPLRVLALPLLQVLLDRLREPLVVVLDEALLERLGRRHPLAAADEHAPGMVAVLERREEGERERAPHEARR
jgi:hypothetical protein